MECFHRSEVGAYRDLRAALGEAEGIGNVLCFLELAMAVEGADMLLTHYARRGLAGLLGDCSRRVDRVCRLLDRALGEDEPEACVMAGERKRTS